MSQLLRQLRASGVLPEDSLQAALRRQQIYGGSLDTVLLELDLLDAPTLNRELAAANECDPVPVALLEPGPERPWNALPKSLLDLGWAMPLRNHLAHVQVAVHPEIPAEQRSQLERAIEYLQVFVTCEACLAKLAAERRASVMPQRYAVLALKWMQALREPAAKPEPEPAAPAAPWLTASSNTAPYTVPPPEDEPEPKSGPVFDAPRSAPAPSSAPGQDRDPGEPPPVKRNDTFLYGLPVDDDDDDLPPPEEEPEPEPQPEPEQEPEQEPEPEPEEEDAPTPRTVANRGVEARPSASLQERLAGPRSALEDAATRDQATEALVRAAMVISPRVALFGIKREGLRGLEAPGQIPEIVDQLVELSPKIEAAIESRERLDRVTDLDLRIAVGREMAVPCLFVPVKVHDRPVLMLYVDRDEGPFSDEEIAAAEDLCAVAANTLEGVLVRMRGGADEPAPPAPSPPAPSSAPPSPPPVAPPSPPPVAPPAPSSAPAPAAPAPPPPGRVVVPPSRPQADTPSLFARPGSSLLLQGVFNAPAGEAAAASKSPAPAPPVAAPPASSPPVAKPPAPAVSAPPAPAIPATPPPTADKPAAPPSTPSIPPVRLKPPVRTPPPSSNPGSSAPGPAPGPEKPPVRLSPPNPAAPPLSPPASPPAKPPVRLERSAPTSTPTPTPTPTPSSSSEPPTSRPNVEALSTPLGNRSETIRGRIQIDDEDRPHTVDPKLQEIDSAIQSAMRGDSSAIAFLRESGEPALRRISKQFPGELDVHRRDLDTLPPLPAHGPLIRVALEIGSALGPYLVELIDHPNPTVRFYIAFVFMELRHELAVAALGELAFDPDADVRAIAMRVLETYSGEPGFDDSVKVIRRELDSPNRTRQLHATRAVGTVRDIASVSKLIDLLASKERYIQEASLESLCSITGQQLGLKPHRWRSWYGDNSHHHRIEWIMSSLAHKDLSVRRWAADELRRITGQRINFLAAGTKQEREIGIRKWIEWWNEQGRAEFGG